MNEVRKRVENIFAHAAALQQNGRLKNTIYCLGDSVFIMNQDHTVLMRCPLRRGEKTFEHPVSFMASDYDSNKFTEKDGRIVFIQKEGKYIRQKSCRTPDHSPKQVQKYYKDVVSSAKRCNKIVLDEDFIKLLDEELSHIEFKVEGGEFICQQRNIYSGSVVTIKQQKSDGLLAAEPLKDFSSIGVRTNDFLALFSFVGSVAFYFVGKDVVLFESNEKAMPFTGIISQCVYDELGG